MSGMVTALFGGMTDAQKQQQKVLNKQQSDQNAVEAGQATLRSGGGGSSLSFTQDTGTGKQSLGAAGDAITGLKGLNRLLGASA